MIYCLNCCTLNNEKEKICSSCSSSLEFCPKEKLKKEIILAERYKLITPLNKGGMGELYGALDLRLNSICAVKELYLSSITDEEKDYRLKRFKSEVEILAKLRHQSLPHVFDYFLENEKYYLVMDYIAGNDLEAILEKEGRPALKENRVIQWGVTLCDLLDYLHNNKPQIIYRDLKPANIMLRAKDNQLILIDFGTARIMAPHSKHQTAIGTVGYAPPEQYMGEPDSRSDIYALGATLYHLVTGTLPLLPFEFKPARKINSSVSAKLETVLAKALEKEAKNRYQTAVELKEDLLYIIPTETTGTSVPVIQLPPEKEEKWDLLGKIKRNILNSINKLRKEFYTNKMIKIFIMEDSSTQLSLYRNSIESSSDIEITGLASKVEELLEKIKISQEKPDIILMDITVNEENIKAITDIKNIDPSAKIVILSSTDLDRETVLSALKAGVTGYIIKKESHENIIEGIRKAYEGGSPIEAEVVTYLLDEFVNKTRVEKETVTGGFDGLELDEVDLFDLLIEFCLCEITGKMSVKSPFENGDIYVEEGEITHCVYGTLTKEEAFYQTVNWFTGKGRFYGGERPEKRTIYTPTDELLSEVIKRKEKFVQIRKVVKSPDDIFKVHLASSAIITLQADYMYILLFLDEKKTLLDIMKETGKTYFDIAQIIYELYSSGIVQRVG